MTCYHVFIKSTGSTDGKVHCWSTETGMRVVVLNGEHSGPVQCVQFNPKYMMLATACTNMVSSRISSVKNILENCKAHFFLAVL